ncbi:unnamed protein product [Schistosoma margrebowiei]|uniref:Uncharacterized protein n=1 Tax=Schistosoma margrebowiei TaxID=48269 RepID=A0A183MBF6_9TREM|nr:unnamed protein product [Schistosoma margrebowiei]
MNYTFTSIFPSFTTSIIALLATTISTATLGGNIIVLIAFFIERSLRIPSNYFIASLAMTDVLIDFSACLTSQYTVFLITLDRFCLVKIPAKYRNWRTYNKVSCFFLVLYIYISNLLICQILLFILFHTYCIPYPFLLYRSSAKIHSMSDHHYILAYVDISNPYRNTTEILMALVLIIETN